MRLSYLHILVGFTLAGFVLVACHDQKTVSSPWPATFSLQTEVIGFYDFPEGCEETDSQGSALCPRSWVSPQSPLEVELTAEALDELGDVAEDFSGEVLVDLRPGVIVNAPPGGVLLSFVAGRSVSRRVKIAGSWGKTHFWLEECGGGGRTGSFTTVLSSPFYFESPRIAMLQSTKNTLKNAFAPSRTSACAVSGDARYALGVDESGAVAIVGVPGAGPMMLAPHFYLDGFVSASESPDLGEESAEGEMLVTAVFNDGFYVEDFGRFASPLGFNSIFVKGDVRTVRVGDRLAWLQGSLLEEGGMSVLSGASFEIHSSGAALPAPMHLTAALFHSVVGPEGHENPSNTSLESLEGSRVCMDHLAPAHSLMHCDVNQDGKLELGKCYHAGGFDDVPSCPATNRRAEALSCEEISADSLCSELTELQQDQCVSDDQLPLSPAEYCCHQICIADPACTLASPFYRLGLWSANIYGNYEQDSSTVNIKVNIRSRDGAPAFNSFAFAQTQLSLPVDQRQFLRVTGILYHMAEQTPPWVIDVSAAVDIQINAECP
ncbi:hypothetical protein KAI87_00790 [Myxococcota bacterium]|nr:hypothetical protein [Myxococcota bacterium]